MYPRARTLEVVSSLLDTVGICGVLPHGGDLDELFAQTDAPWKFNQDGSPAQINEQSLRDAIVCVESSIAVQRLKEFSAPNYLLIAEAAAAAYRGYRASESPEGAPLSPLDWMKPQDEICVRLELGQSEKRTFRFWSRVARLNHLIESKFEATAKDIGFSKLVSEGKPDIYVGTDREHTAKLSGLYFKTVTDQFFRLCVLFACDTSNTDVYRNFLELGGDPKKIGIASHIDEYFLRNVGNGRDLEDYTESFVRQLRSFWDQMKISNDGRLEIDGLAEKPQEIVQALRRFHKSLQLSQVWNHVIFGLGPEKRPHIIFLDDLGEPLELFNQTEFVELSGYVQERDISRGQNPHTHAISLGTIEALSGTSMQQTFYVDPITGDPSKARGLVKALGSFPPNRHHSVGVCQFAPSRWRFFTDAASAAVIEDSRIYRRVL